MPHAAVRPARRAVRPGILGKGSSGVTDRVIVLLVQIPSRLIVQVVLRRDEVLAHFVEVEHRPPRERAAPSVLEAAFVERACTRRVDEPHLHVADVGLTLLVVDGPAEAKT